MTAPAALTRPARVRVVIPGWPPCWLTTAQPTSLQEVRLTLNGEEAHVASSEDLQRLATLLSGYAVLCGSELQFQAEDAS